MFKKIDIKWLAIVFVILLIIVIAVTWQSEKGNSSFKSDITSVDTSLVEQIIILPRGSSEQIEIKTESNNWLIKVGEDWFNADNYQINNMLGSLMSLKAKRMAANDKSRWNGFEVTDSLATRVKFLGAKKATLDIYLGKFSFQQVPSQNPYQQQQNQMTTYVRLANEKEVYAVDGLLSMSFNRSVNDFRNRSIIAIDKDKVSKINFTRPEESFSLIKEGNNFMVGGLVADSLVTAEYLIQIERLLSSDFVSAEARTTNVAKYSMVIELENGVQPVKIDAFPSDTTYGYLISSSLNKGSFFNGKSADLFEKAFVSKDHFFADGSMKESTP